MNPALEKFGRILIQEVRDYVNEDMQKIINGEMRGAQAAKLHTAIKQHPESRQLLDTLVPHVIDRTLSQLLFTLQENPEFEILVHDSDGKPVNVVAESDGLAGELFGEGWIQRYSKYPRSPLEEH